MVTLTRPAGRSGGRCPLKHLITVSPLTIYKSYADVIEKTGGGEAVTNRWVIGFANQFFVEHVEWPRLAPRAQPAARCACPLAGRAAAKTGSYAHMRLNLRLFSVFTTSQLRLTSLVVSPEVLSFPCA